MDTSRDLRIPFLGLGCASEAAALERMLSQVAGVLRVYVNPVTETVYAEVDGLETEERLLARLEAAGYRSYVPGRPRRRLERHSS